MRRRIVSMSGGKDSAVIFELAKLIAAELGRLPLKCFWLDQEAEWLATEDYNAGRHACPGGQAVLVPDSLPADQRPFFATSAMFIALPSCKIIRCEHARR